jgi:hypothetical protein
MQIEIKKIAYAIEQIKMFKSGYMYQDTMTIKDLLEEAIRLNKEYLSR